MPKTHAAITAVGAYVPDYILNNQELETMMDTTDEWIQTRTGIRERHILKGKDMGTSEMAVGAIRNMLSKRPDLDPLDIELVICATTTPDVRFPATANTITDKAGLKNAWGFDINAACSGFIYSLTTAAQFIESGLHKKVLVIGGDKMSSIANYEDRTTAVLFGDAAGCVLLEPAEEGLGLIDSVLRSDGSGRNYLYQKAGGSARPATMETVLAKEHYLYQEGQTVFKFAVKKMADVSAEIMERNHLTADDVTWLIPHQANLRIIDATRQRMGLDPSKVMVNIERYGNTTNATLPLCMWEWESRLKKGDNIVLAAFGSGFTWGATYLRWAYDGKE